MPLLFIIIIIKGKCAETAQPQFVWSDIFIFFLHINIPGLH